MLSLKYKNFYILRNFSCWRKDNRFDAGLYSTDFTLHILKTEWDLTNNKRVMQAFAHQEITGTVTLWYVHVSASPHGEGCWTAQFRVYWTTKIKILSLSTRKKKIPTFTENFLCRKKRIRVANMAAIEYIYLEGTLRLKYYR